MNPADSTLALWPAAASVSARHADHLILAFTLLTLVLVVPIFVGTAIFAVVFREGRVANRDHRVSHSQRIELAWMLIPFALTLYFFVWGAQLFHHNRHPPANALPISAIGRQWMWKFEHPGGQGEINNLHVPTGQPIRITMISQDVIHGLYLPALRAQMETLPGRYTDLWFTADKPGSYRLLCTEYCGTDHSVMGGLLVAMTPPDYQAWLETQSSGGSLAEAGRRLYVADGCSGCHGAGATVRAPGLAGLFGKPVPMLAGGTVIADEAYLRDKILYPDHNPIAGYRQVMPSYAGVIAESDLLRLVAYIKSLAVQPLATETETDR